MIKIVNVERFKKLFGNICWIFPSLMLKFDKKGIHFREISKNHIILGECEITDFEIIDTFNEIDIGIDAFVLSNIIDCLDEEYPVYIDVDYEYLYIENGLSSFMIKTIDVEEFIGLRPQFTPTLNVVTETEQLWKVIEYSDNIGSDDLKFISKQDTHKLSAAMTGGRDDSNVILEMVINHLSIAAETSLNVNFCVTDLRNILSCIGRDSIIELNFADNSPLEIIVEDEFLKLNFLYAPRIQDDDEEHSFFQKLHKMKSMGE